MAHQPSPLSYVYHVFHGAPIETQWWNNTLGANNITTTTLSCVQHSKGATTTFTSAQAPHQVNLTFLSSVPGFLGATVGRNNPFQSV